MKFYESVDSSKPVIFLFPGTCCLYSSFDHVLDGLHSYFYTVLISKIRTFGDTTCSMKNCFAVIVQSGWKK